MGNYPYQACMSEPVLKSCSCSALRQASRHVTRFYDDALAPLGIGVNQYSILANLERLGPSPIQELARHLVMDRSTLGHLLRPLEARGFVRLAVPDQDRRRRLLSLTAAGQAHLGAARPVWARAEKRFETVFGHGEAQSLRTLLETAATADYGALTKAPDDISQNHASNEDPRP